MIGSSQEGGRRAERLSHALRLPFAVAIGATAVLGSQAQAFSDNNYTLPQLHVAHPGEKPFLEASVTTDDTQIPGYHYTTNSLPAAFASAFDNALHSPVVQIGFREKAMAGVDVFATSNSNRKEEDRGDNGEWSIYNNHVSLLPFTDEQPEASRLFADARVVPAVLEHETLHALNEKWYRFIRQADMPRPSRFDSLLINASSELQQTLDVALNGLHTACQVGQAYNHAFDCRKLSPVKFSGFLRETYRCTTEGYALQQPLDHPQPLALGHPYDNLTETASSLLLSIDSNPSYVKDCLSTTTDMNILLRKLSGTILRLVFTATPPLETYFRKDSEKAATIDWLLEAA